MNPKVVVITTGGTIAMLHDAATGGAGRYLLKRRLRLFSSSLAGLVGDAAAGLAGALAGGLALAAAAVFDALFQVTRVQGLDSLHMYRLLIVFFGSIVAHRAPFVNRKPADAAARRGRTAPKGRAPAL